MCWNSSAGLGGRAERRAQRNTIQRHLESGRRNPERDALRNLGRSSDESERSLRKGARFWSLVDLLLRSVRQEAPGKGRYQERCHQALRETQAAGARRQEAPRKLS